LILFEAELPDWATETCDWWGAQQSCCEATHPLILRELFIHHLGISFFYDLLLLDNVLVAVDFLRLLIRPRGMLLRWCQLCEIAVASRLLSALATWLSGQTVLLHFHFDQLNDKVESLEVRLFTPLMLLNRLLNFLEYQILRVILVIWSVCDNLHDAYKKHLYELLCFFWHESSIKFEKTVQSPHVLTFLVLGLVVLLLSSREFLAEILINRVHHGRVIGPLARDGLWIRICCAIGLRQRDLVRFVVEGSFLLVLVKLKW
jgi:hypothetical protein